MGPFDVMVLAPCRRVCREQGGYHQGGRNWCEIEENKNDRERRRERRIVE